MDPAASSLWRQVSKWCEYWQSQIHLMDWSVQLVLETTDRQVFRTRDEIQWGSIVYDTATQRATMTLLVLEDEAKLPYPHWTYDLQETLVHELIHLKLVNTTNVDGIDEDEIERLCNHLAEALVAHRRALESATT